MLAFANMAPSIFTYYEKQIIYERELELALSQGKNRRTLLRTGSLRLIKIVLSSVAAFAKGVRTKRFQRRQRGHTGSHAASCLTAVHGSQLPRLRRVATRQDEAAHSLTVL